MEALRINLERLEKQKNQISAINQTPNGMSYRDSLTLEELLNFVGDVIGQLKENGATTIIAKD